MPFNKIIGQHRVKLFFQKALERGRISHAYLMVGDRGVGKEATALELAKALFCSNNTSKPCQACSDCLRVAKLSHPDLRFIFPAPTKVTEDERKRILKSIATNPYQRKEIWANPSISIEQIREIRRASAFKSLEDKGRVIIIVDAERMTLEASNALLKILEEPPQKMYLLLISSRANLLLPTITSRCQLIKFDPLTVEEIEKALIERNSVKANQARLSARLAAGSYRQALELLDEHLQELRDQALEFFRKSIQSDFKQIIFVEDFLHSMQQDSKKIKDILILLTNWFRDVMVFLKTEGDHTDRLVNFDQVDVLKKFTNKFPNADLYSAVQEIEKSLELIDRNVQLNLILIVLLSKLRNYVRR
ncbi:MAG: DNA polymerase III subunit delta' [bacterium]